MIFLLVNDLPSYQLLPMSCVYSAHQERGKITTISYLRKLLPRGLNSRLKRLANGEMDLDFVFVRVDGVRREANIDSHRADGGHVA